VKTMDRFIFGILTTIVLLVCVSLVLYSFDRAEIIDLQKGTLLILGHIPGWEELPEELEAGRGRLKNWKEKEKTYLAQIDRLKMDNNKLQQELKKTREEVEAMTVAMTKEQERLAEAVDAEANKALEEQTARLIAEMKPKAAAGYLAKIPAPVAINILRNLEPRKAAKIMEAMPTEDGSALIAMMAETP